MRRCLKRLSAFIRVAQVSLSFVFSTSLFFLLFIRVGWFCERLVDDFWYIWFGLASAMLITNDYDELTILISSFSHLNPSFFDRFLCVVAHLFDLFRF